jgi:hypothetical protein
MAVFGLPDFSGPTIYQELHKPARRRFAALQRREQVFALKQSGAPFSFWRVYTAISDSQVGPLGFDDAP